MARVKSEEVRQAILSAAQMLFAEQGYVGTTINKIAGVAGTSPANVYVYFPSKLDIAFAIYEPWFRDALSQIVREGGSIYDPREKLRFLLDGLWRRLPGDNGGLSSIFIEAITTATPSDRYNPRLLLWAEDLLARIVAECRHPGRPAESADRDFAHVMMMAFDGFVLSQRLGAMPACNEHLVDIVADAILRTDGPPAKPRAS